MGHNYIHHSYVPGVSARASPRYSRVSMLVGEIDSAYVQTCVQTCAHAYIQTCAHTCAQTCAHTCVQTGVQTCEQTGVDMDRCSLAKRKKTQRLSASDVPPRRVARWDGDGPPVGGGRRPRPACPASTAPDLAPSAGSPCRRGTTRRRGTSRSPARSAWRPPRRRRHRPRRWGPLPPRQPTP